MTTRGHPNRSHEDIIEAMLKIATKGASQTNIMYDAHLTHRQVMNYLGDLQKKQFIAIDGNTKTLKTTNKGKKYLEIREALKKLEGIHTYSTID